MRDNILSISYTHIIMTKLAHLLTISVVLLMGYYYINAFSRLEADTLTRPFANRQLIPTLAWQLQVLFQWSYAKSAYFLLLLFTFLMQEALRVFYSDHYGNGIHTEVYVLFTSLMVFFLALLPPHSYDIPTVFLFTLSLVLLYRQRIAAFVLLFPIVALNRETAIMLIPVFFLYQRGRITSRKNISLTILMIIVYIGIRVILKQSLEHFPGEDMVFYFWGNLRFYAKNPYTVMVIILMVVSLFFMVRNKWEDTPYLVRLSLATLLIILVPMHALFGISMEYRVFLETVPLFTLIALYNKEEAINGIAV